MWRVLISRELLASISGMMHIDDEYIRGISVRSTGPQECQVTFNVISYGQLNLVEELEKLQQKLAEVLDSSFECGGANFVPVDESIAVRVNMRTCVIKYLSKRISIVNVEAACLCLHADL